MHDKMDEDEKNVIDNIEEHGFYVMHILEEDDLPRFSYSIGIYEKTGQPDLVITGLKRDVTYPLINDYNDRVKSGEIFTPDVNYSEFVDDFDVTFKEVEKQYFKEHFGWGIWFYGNASFPVLQMVYPDKSGKWPWDENISDDFKWFQPVLSAC
jgi:hypothetical protein